MSRPCRDRRVEHVVHTDDAAHGEIDVVKGDSTCREGTAPLDHSLPRLLRGPSWPAEELGKGDLRVYLPHATVRIGKPLFNLEDPGSQCEGLLADAGTVLVNGIAVAVA